MTVEGGQAIATWREGTVVRRLLSIDHKQIGALYLLAAGFFLVGAGIARLLFFLDLAHVPGGLLSSFGAFQVSTFEATALIFGFGLPLTLGLAIYVVPLQIGARSIAWPRMNACAFWLYLAGISIMLSSFAAGDPSESSPAVPLSPEGQQLWLTGLLIVGVAAALASAVLVQSVRTRRAEGMTWARLPLFTWSAVAYAGALALGMTISSIAAAVFLIDDGSARGFFVYDATPDFAFYQRSAWFMGHALTYALFVPIVGILAEAVSTVGRRAPGARVLARAAIWLTTGLAGLVGVYHLLADALGDGFANGFTLTGFVLLAVLAPGVLAWRSGLPGPHQWTDLRRPPEPIVVLVAGVITVLGIGTILGLALGFTGDYKADSSSLHLFAHFDGTLAGAALLGLTAGVLYWFPKITGRRFDERFARPGALLLTLGTLCVMVGEHVAGEGDLAAFSAAAKAGTTLALAGYLLTFLGGAQLLGGVFLSLRLGVRLGNDPWRGDSLEWYPSSPPPPHNFDRVPQISSHRPLHDLRKRLGTP